MSAHIAKTTQTCFFQSLWNTTVAPQWLLGYKDCCTTTNQGRSQRVETGDYAPNRQWSGFLTKKNWFCWDIGPNTVLSTRSVLWASNMPKNIDPTGELMFWSRRLKKFGNFFGEKVHPRRANLGYAPATNVLTYLLTKTVLVRRWSVKTCRAIFDSNSG